MSKESTKKLGEAKTANIYEDYEFDLFLFKAATDKLNPAHVYNIYSDGASRGNPGPCGVGMVFYDSNGREVYRESMSLRQGTNNFAEYCAAIYALKTALNLGIRKACLHIDVELLVKQINGIYKVNEELRPCHTELQSLAEKFEDLTIKWVPNQMNRVADTLAKQAIKGVMTGEEVSSLPGPQEGSSSKVMQQEKIVVKKNNDVPKMRQKTLLDFCKKPVVVSKVNEIPIEKIKPVNWMLLPSRLFSQILRESQRKPRNKDGLNQVQYRETQK